METWKLLLVDDVDLFLHLEETFLTRRAFQISKARSGEQALRRVREERLDLIVMDLHMPEMDGDVACRLLKGDPETRSIPIIMVSAGNRAEDRKRCLDAGCQAYMTKPVGKEDLCRVVEEQLHLAVRVHRRVNVEWPCTVILGEENATGTIRNISEGGAFVVTDHSVINGRKIQVHFHIPGCDWRSLASARVCWAGQLDGGGPAGFGITFQILGAEDLQGIRDYVGEARSGCDASPALEDPVFSSLERNM